MHVRKLLSIDLKLLTLNNNLVKSLKVFPLALIVPEYPSINVRI